MKHNVITLLGVVAILAAIVVVRSIFEQSPVTEADEQAAEEARRDLVEAAEISKEANAEGGSEESSESAEEGADKGAPASTSAQSDFEEIVWADTAPETFQVKFETTAGAFVVESHQSWAPLGHERFYELCKIGFFNDSGFFRVVPGFVVQFGLAADPKLTAQYKNKRLRDEPVRKSNQRGKITFATSGKDSRTTQLFINYGDNARLDDMGFTPFGEVIAGMENVDAITDQYGEFPDQGAITQRGTAYLKDAFPNLDFIKKVTLVQRKQAESTGA